MSTAHSRTFVLSDAHEQGVLHMHVITGDLVMLLSAGASAPGAHHLAGPHIWLGLSDDVGSVFKTFGPKGFEYFHPSMAYKFSVLSSIDECDD